MSKIHLRLSYKNILILKHSLEKRIEIHETIWGTLRQYVTPESPHYEMYLKEEVDIIGEEQIAKRNNIQSSPIRSRLFKWSHQL